MRLRPQACWQVPGSQVSLDLTFVSPRREDVSRLVQQQAGFEEPLCDVRQRMCHCGVGRTNGIKARVRHPAVGPLLIDNPVEVPARHREDWDLPDPRNLTTIPL